MPRFNGVRTTRGLPHRPRAFLCLAAALILCSGLRAEVLDVQVAPARSRLVNHEDLPRYCSGLTEIDACTVVRGARLTCHCKRDEDGWRLGGWAQFIPYVYLTEGRFLEHENAHVGDLRLQIETWFSALAERRFATEQACLASSQSESAAFPDLMQVFRGRSNERLH